MKIKLRTKTEAHLNKLFDTRKTDVIKYMENFMEFPEEKAFFEMVKIKVWPERILERNKLLKGVTTDTILKIYGDLAANYKAEHPNCWLSREEYPEYLCKAFDNDKTIIKFVEEKIQKRIQSGFVLDIDRIHFLLQSENEKYWFGALKELWFNKAQANYFKDYAKVIDKYFSELILNEAKVTPTICVPEESCNSLYDTTLKEENDKTEIPSVSSSTFAIDVISNSDKIKEFLCSCNNIKAAGFDPEIILREKEKIESLLKAAENL